MTVEDAIRRIAELRSQLPSVKEEGYGHRFGKVFIDESMIQRGLEPPIQKLPDAGAGQCPGFGGALAVRRLATGLGGYG